ncbi:hypothetical protein [Actinomadura sp. 3N407]|uniref:hypothetical protein n=1 Tax=Actinomadura sp. 3N407 TaxID=3457423 RepID=UPI003FCDEAB8
MNLITNAAPSGAPASAGSTNLLLLLLTSSVVAGLITHLLSSLRSSAEARRDRYAEAVKLLVAKLEYPYRIRRRTSDEPEVLALLAAAGHDLQEQLAEMRAWIAAENGVLSEVFDRCLSRLDEPVAQACNDAWRNPPILAAEQMNLNGFGPGDQQHVIFAIRQAIRYRFGIRRFLPARMVRDKLHSL